MKNKIIILAFLTILAMVFTIACEEMDDNYAKYLEQEKIYSPKINNLRSYPTLRVVSLAWDNPSGSIAKKIMIDYQDSIFISDVLIDSITITGLEIKGYTIAVYTLDAFDNKSVPESVTVFPNGEQ